MTAAVVPDRDVAVPGARPWFGRWVRGRAGGSLFAPALGLCLGQDAASGAPVVVDDDTLRRHGLIVGASGAGKTSLMLYIAYGQVRRGGGLLLIDAKADTDLLRELLWMAARAGRLADVRVVTPALPELSHTWNFLEVGTATEVTSKLMLLAPFQPEGGLIFRETQHSVLLGIVEGLQALGRRFHLGDVVACLVIPESLLELLEELRQDGRPRARRALVTLRFALESFGRGKDDVDWSQYVYWVSSLGRILYRYCVGDRGRIILAHAGDVQMVRDIPEGRIVYMQLPILQEPESAWDYAKVIMMDLMTAVGHLNVSGQRGPRLPFLVLADEFAHYATGAFRAIFEQARSAGVCIYAAIQSYGQLKGDPKKMGDVLQIVEDNTAVKLILRLGSAVSLREAAEALGKRRDVVLRQASTATRGEGRRSGIHWSAQVEDEYVVRPEELAEVDVGEAVYRILPGRPGERVRTGRVRWDYLPGRVPVAEKAAVMDVFRQAAERRLAGGGYDRTTCAGFWERYERGIQQKLRS